MDKCPFCGAEWEKDILDGAGHPHKIYKCGTAVYIYDQGDANRTLICREITTLRSLLRKAMQEWGSCTRSNDPYTINRFENFSNRPEVKAVMEEKP